MDIWYSFVINVDEIGAQYDQYSLPDSNRDLKNIILIRYTGKHNETN